MDEEMNMNHETPEGVDGCNGSEDENVNEIEELDFEEIDFRLLNEDEVKKYQFLNSEITYKFYKMYGMKKEFGIRKYHNRRDKDGEILWQSFFCDREGFRDKKNDLIRKRAPRKETRCGCLARMKIHIDKEKGDWYVSYFVDEHNHELVDEHYGAMIAFNRRMIETDVAQMNTMREVDGCSIFDYSIFGDVLAFDATYSRNNYKFPVVIFSGVNHHKQTTVFATVVVSNETDETYVWLLEKFFEAMNGKHPKFVITDGDLSMKNAIRRVFPEVHHRWTKKAKDVQRLNFQQCDLSKESVESSRYRALSDGCRVLCNFACKTEEDFTEMLEKIYNECSRLRLKQQSSETENVENVTEEQVRDPIRVRAKGRAPGMTTKGKRGHQCSICREIGHNRASCPNVVDSCSRIFDEE
ncbi:hypothetical protein Lal_00026973 [Lupinus albus]|nr:hypothetical protein Lal_00026973 [Lupinus albus]